MLRLLTANTLDEVIAVKENYKPIGDFIRVVNNRNKNLAVTQLVGLSIDKCYIASVANVIGTDLSTYKIIKYNQFACSLMQVSRDAKIPIACMKEYDEAIMSPAYVIFEIIDETLLLPDYLNMWIMRAEFDREASFLAVGGVRGSLALDDFCRMKLPVPSIEEQKNIVEAYKAITDRIALKKQINDNLEATGLAIFKEMSKEKQTATIISDFCDFQEGYVNPPQEFPQYFDGNIKWLRGVDFSSQIIINTSRTLTDEGFNSAGKSALLFEPNTIVITKSGTIGKLGIIADYMCGNRATINIKPKRKDLLPFVYFFLKSIQPQFYDMAVGSAQVNLYVSVLQQIACPEYDDTFEKFTNQATLLLDELINNSKEIIYLSELQEIILGELSR